MTDQVTPLSVLQLDDEIIKILEAEPNNVQSVEQLETIDDLKTLHDIGKSRAKTIADAVDSYREKEVVSGNDPAVPDTQGDSQTGDPNAARTANDTGSDDEATVETGGDHESISRTEDQSALGATTENASGPGAGVSAPGNESQVTDGAGESETGTGNQVAPVGDNQGAAIDHDSDPETGETETETEGSPQPQYSVSSLFEIPVPIVISDRPAGYVSRDVELKLDREQIETLELLLSGARQTPELTTKAGQAIVTASDLFIFLLDVIGAQIPKNAIWGGSASPLADVEAASRRILESSNNSSV